MPEANVTPRIPETLPQEILTRLHAPEKPDYPVITPDIMVTYDGFLFGVPTRFGNMPAQWRVCHSSEIYSEGGDAQLVL